MNCKPGDLARMVGCGIPQSNGLIVDVISAATEAPIARLAPYWNCKAISGAKSDIGYTLPGDWCLIPDVWLRPIRGEKQEDETLSWKAVPKPDPVHLIANDAERGLRAASNPALRLVVGTAPTELGRPRSA